LLLHAEQHNAEDRRAYMVHHVQTAASFSLPQSLDFSHLLPPEPVAFPRKVLDQRFAVLLLRSTYDAVDALDFIAMVGPGTSTLSGVTLLATIQSSSTRNCEVCKHSGTKLAYSLQDQFQIQFWKTRQAEYEPYLLQYSPIRVRQVYLRAASLLVTSR